MNTRRRLLALAASWGLCAALPVRAQPAPARIAWFSMTTEGDALPFLDALRNGLRELGYAEGRNLLIEPHWANNSAERAAALAAQIVASRPHVIVTLGPTALAARRATRDIPIVFGFSGDPVEAGLVQSFSRPGGNLSGIYFLTLDLVGKRFEVLKELVPRARRVAILANPQHPGDKAERRASQVAAGALGLEVEYFEARSGAEIDAALSAIQKSGAEAAVMFPLASIMARREHIARWAVEHRIPTVSGWAQFAEGGNLATYGPNLHDTFRRLAAYADKVLKGAKPADIPVEQPSTVELVVNLRAARALGLTVPNSVLIRANRVIE